MADLLPIVLPPPPRPCGWSLSITYCSIPQALWLVPAYYLLFYPPPQALWLVPAYYLLFYPPPGPVVGPCLLPIVLPPPRPCGWSLPITYCSTPPGPVVGPCLLPIVLPPQALWLVPAYYLLFYPPQALWLVPAYYLLFYPPRPCGWSLPITWSSKATTHSLGYGLLALRYLLSMCSLL